MKILRVLSIVLLLVFLALPSGAETFYVRPAGGSYGSEDGLSYDNAWDGLTNVQWANPKESGKVGPGDTLYICGIHLATWTSSGLIATKGDITPVSGTSGHLITIRGDYPGDPGVFWGGYNEEFGDAWTDNEDGSWTKTIGCTAYPDWFMEYDFDTDTFIVLDKVSSKAECASTDSSFYYNEGTRALTVNPVDNSDPWGRIIISRFGYDWILYGLSYIKFLNLTAYVYMWSYNNISYITWENCKLWYGEHSLIKYYSGDHITIQGCDIAWGNNGIYVISNGNSEDYISTNGLISGNYIHDIGVRDSQQNADAHSVGTQAVDDFIIEKNYSYNCGTGPTIYAYAAQTPQNNIIRYNYVKDCHTLGGTTGYGIFTMCDNDSLSDKFGNKIYGNITTGCTIGYRLRFEDETLWFNNVSYKDGVGMQATRSYETGGVYYGPKVKGRNNLIIEPTTYFIEYSSSTSAESQGNAYLHTDYQQYPDGNTGTKFRVQGADYNFNNYQALNDSETGRIIDEDNSVVTAHNLADPDNGDFTPSSSPPTGEDQGTYLLSSAATWPTSTGGGTFTLLDADTYGWYTGAFLWLGDGGGSIEQLHKGMGSVGNMH